ncbi:MAG: hypothetical protein AVDCRST_MAG65-1977, partial [uncultured Solirubrobacteraceae bacterium]
GFADPARHALRRPGDRLPGDLRPDARAQSHAGAGVAGPRRPADRQRRPADRPGAERRL